MVDTRRQGLWGTVTHNGKHLLLPDNMCITGSIMSIMAEGLKALQAERARLTPDGEMEVVIRIRNQPIATDKESTLILGRSEELGALIEGEADKPREDESYEDFYNRLANEGYPKPSAEYIACQWFGRESSPELTLWLNDPKALRFRELNSRDDAYEAALPSEYESLKNYVRTTYPMFVQGLTFRTA
jgi:hypothetical protein